MKLFLTALFSASLSFSALANEAITARLQQMGEKNIEIKDTPVSNIKMVNTDNGSLLISKDGKFIFSGMYEMTDKGPVDIVKQELLNKLNSLKKEMIIYPAKNQKYVVTVFFDITCYYCHKLHQQMKEYNDLGITVRYLAFPRKMDQSAHQMEAIFTAKDKAHALNEAEKGNLPKQLKEPNLVTKHYKLGIQFGVQGTPTIITESGNVIPGYAKPEDLLNMLSE